MQFGICLKGDMDLERTLRLARAADQGGFDYVWMFDSHVLWQECYAVLALIAANTRRVKLGPLVTNPTVRSLDVTSSLFATLNNISDGRAVCGMGRGDSSRRMLGKKPSTIARMLEAVRTIRALVRGEEVTLADVPVRLTWANPQYELPMWIAGYGPRVLRESGKVADGIVLQIAEPSLVSWFIEQCEKGVAEAGRAPGELEYMTAAPVYISDDLGKCREQCRWFPGMVGNHVADLIKNQSIGVPESFLRAIEGRDRYDYREHAEKDAEHLDWVTEDIIDGFSVLGPVDRHVEKLKILESAGIDQFVIYLMCGEEEQIVDTYTREVIPAVNVRS